MYKYVKFSKKKRVEIRDIIMKIVAKSITVKNCYQMKMNKNDKMKI